MGVGPEPKSTEATFSDGAPFSISYGHINVRYGGITLYFIKHLPHWFTYF